jgi:hypothetical protein
MHSLTVLCRCRLFYYDRFSSVIGDMFYFSDRLKVPVMHPSAKKAYYVVLRRAWFVWDDDANARVVAALQRPRKSDKEIEEMEYYNKEKAN